MMRWGEAVTISSIEHVVKSELKFADFSISQIHCITKS